MVSGAVEGLVDEAVLSRLVQHVGAEPGPVYGRHGKPPLRRVIDGYNNAARFSPWLILVDLNHEAECAPLMLNTWRPRPAPWLCFRVAVGETGRPSSPSPREIIEVDAPGISSSNLPRFDFKRIRRPIFPLDPETIYP